MSEIERQFVEWEGEVFGYGYGSGEEYVLQALQTFLRHCYSTEGTYDYRKLEAQLGGGTTWLLINALCQCDVIEYGSSPRFGWIDHDEATQKLMRFILNTDVDRLCELICEGWD